MIDYIKIFSPIVTSYLVSSQCPMQKSAGIDVVGRPPGYVFGIVWPILYLLMGYSWFNYSGTYSNFVNIGFVILIILLNSWVVLYGCYDKNSNSLYSILLGILVTIVLIILMCKESINSSLSLVPLTVWLFFALLLNFQELNINKKNSNPLSLSQTI